ncbi:MAG: sigma-70 family RNA polymerase sigma factor [Polyangiaceae bacterium]|nr:sigma-70 family RNA polymerase sigma factor [Polyangiaceae bacterium]
MTPAYPPQSLRRASHQACGLVPVSGSPDQRLSQVLGEQWRCVWRTLRGLGVRPIELDDAVQQVFLTFAKRQDDVEPGKERAFLVQVAVRVASNTRRSHARRPEQGIDCCDLSTHPDPHPEALLDAKQERQALQRILESMPDEQRAVFILFELEGLTSSEIAQALGIPPGTVGSRLRRARNKFHAALRQPSDSAERGDP